MAQAERAGQAEGAEVLAGRALAAEGGLPYAPLVAALRSRLERENAPEDLLGDLWLADRNFWDRYKECRAQGLPGVPREELLGYMQETSEALDLMNIERGKLSQFQMPN